MKFKHLLFLPLISVVIMSCSKGSGNDFKFTPDSVSAPITISVGADAPAATGDDSNLLFGNPSGAAKDIVVNKDNYLIDQGYYVESYNNTKEGPNWVSWHLDAKTANGAVKRGDNFYPSAGLPAGFTIIQTDSFDYADYGFDRGHNCPSADRTSSTAANNSTFLMSNMIPQAPYNNQQTWGNLEDYLRSLVTAGNEVYIIMGSYGSGGTGIKGPFSTISAYVSGTKTLKYPDQKITVPSNVWKVAVVLPNGNGDLARVTASTRVIAVNTPNIQTINSNWKLYITTIDAIEKATGYTLLSNLSTTIHDALKVKVDPGS